MLRHFGAEQVAILDGGFQKWLAEGRPTESGEPRAAPTRASSRRAARRSGHQAADPRRDARLRACSTRAEGRASKAAKPDPRPGVAARPHARRAQPAVRRALRRGRHASSRRTRCERLFDEAGVDPAQPFVASCGSGVTANSLIFAAHLLGNDRGRLYDGSWSEWGADPATPESVGPAYARERCPATSRARGGFRRPASWLASPCGSRPFSRSIEQRLDPGRGRADHPRRAVVEPAPASPRWRRPRQRRRRVIRSTSEAGPAAERLDQPQRMANARKARQRPRHKAAATSVVNRRLQVKHRSGVAGAALSSRAVNPARASLYPCA